MRNSPFVINAIKAAALCGALAFCGTAFSLAPPANATEAARPEATIKAPAQHDARMAWWRDARFGMFIHWGLYAQAGGVWNGKKTDLNNCTEWLMYGGKVPIADYATLAKDFNPTQFDADAWVKAAKDAGMKYIVFTAKHHEGFAMFKTKASPFNIIDATPFKRDPLKELAAACHKYGIKLDLYYSQNLDWHHVGGGAGNQGEWDPAHAGDHGKYVDEIVIPQLRELLTNYGEISELWFDIGRGNVITPERAARIMKMVKELQPNIIVNNRLGGGYQGDIATPEQHIPPTGIPRKDWEACMTMNKSWGYSKLDNDWKSGETLIRNLADISSKGGNYLLNVGPNEKGEIPAPSLERLAEIGRWTKTNGEAIYGTRASIFPQLPKWGRVTTRVNKDGTSNLYAIVFDAPKDGVLTFPGLANKMRGANILGATTPVTFANGDTPTVTVPEAQRSQKNFVIKITLDGMPKMDTAAHANDDGSFTLSPRQAALTNGLLLKIDAPAGLGAGPEENLGSWQNKAATATWQIRSKKAGRYTLKARIGAPAASAGSVLEFVVGDQILPLTIEATGGWTNFKTVEVGTLNLPAGENTLTARVKALNGTAPCNLGKIELIPLR